MTNDNIDIDSENCKGILILCINTFYINKIIFCDSNISIKEQNNIECHKCLLNAEFLNGNMKCIFGYKLDAYLNELKNECIIDNKKIQEIQNNIINLMYDILSKNNGKQICLSIIIQNI